MIDAVPPLDEGLLAAEIGELTDECDLLLGAEDREGEWEWEQEQEQEREQERERAGAGEGSAPVGDRPHSAPRATDYALAAGPATTTAATAEADGMTLSRGTGGSDWRRYPPGLIDASERAVSWEVVRASARTTLTVRAVAAPGPATVDPRLTPRATVDGASGPLEVGLRLVDDLWLGSAGLPDPHTGGLTVDLHLPGFGTPPRLPDEDRATHQEAAAHEDRAARRAVRTRVRNFVRHRLSGAPSATPLLRAEIAAAADDESDF
ncbi:hypothetical protein DVH02_34285 [Streptomyces corynorhini]|uniref:Uncharacterized protein n=1 Tax=Streptomyces corynorhini TaxID=2282652 RepID=A0A370ALC3_9ACTN|nr:hypothetical protein DVH02_34285 [Streptomyces corynorhini]